MWKGDLLSTKHLFLGFLTIRPSSHQWSIQFSRFLWTKKVVVAVGSFLDLSQGHDLRTCRNLFQYPGKWLFICVFCFYCRQEKKDVRSLWQRRPHQRRIARTKPWRRFRHGFRFLHFPRPGRRVQRVFRRFRFWRSLFWYVSSDPAEFFGSIRVFMSISDFHDHSSSHRSRRNRHSHPQNALRTPFINPFGFALGNSLVDDFFNGSSGGFSSFSSFNSTFTNGSPTNANVKRTSTSTRFVNGKKITTKK